MSSSASSESHSDGPSPDDTIRLDQFLKLSDCAETGGAAKTLIQAGLVTVNGEIETRRRRKLRPGDKVVCDGQEVWVLTDDDSESASEE